MSNTPIKKSFLFKLSPPFIRRLAPPNLLSIPILLYYKLTIYTIEHTKKYYNFIYKSYY